jgi:hypothetical protein
MGGVIGSCAASLLEKQVGYGLGIAGGSSSCIAHLLDSTAFLCSWLTEHSPCPLGSRHHHVVIGKCLKFHNVSLYLAFGTRQLHAEPSSIPNPCHGLTKHKKSHFTTGLPDARSTSHVHYTCRLKHAACQKQRGSLMNGAAASPVQHTYVSL